MKTHEASQKKPPVNSNKSLFIRFLRGRGGNVMIEYGLLIMLVGVTMAGALSMVANSRVDATIADLRDVLAPNSNISDGEGDPGTDRSILTGSIEKDEENAAD